LNGGPDLIVSGRRYCCCRASARSAAVRQDRCAGAGGPDHPAWPLYSGVVSVFVTGDAVLVADGGLVTELEVRGNDLSDSLWSARLLMDAPEEILDAPLPFFRAGPDRDVGELSGILRGVRAAKAWPP
jgi:homocysteine S-methyltransferase